MCKDKIMWFLSGAFGLDALAHLLNAFGVSWTYHLDKTLSLVAFVAALVLALVFGYWANNYSKQMSGIQKKSKSMKKK